MTAATATQAVVPAIRRLPGRAMLLVLAVAVAYHYSLLSLARGLTLQTPLAYLGLVPFIALIIGSFHAIRWRATSPYDLRLDFTLGRLFGLALVILAIGIAVVVPRTSGIDFWLLRVDILSMPVFVAGIVALLYGVRRLWTLRFAVLFLLLAWPAPYLAFMADTMAASVTATVRVLSVIAIVLPLATPVGGSDGLFLIGQGDQAIPVAIASACSGVNSIVGFGLVGLSLFAVVRGPLARRLVWLVAGVALTWVLNLLRIEVIFLAGAVGSPQLALNVLHPVAGLVVFNVGLLIMVLVVERFGLRVSLNDVESSRETRPPLVLAPPHRVRSTVAVVGAAALTMAVVNASYAAFRPIGGDQGLPTISGFQPGRAWVEEWSSRKVADYTHGRQFFGDDSTWSRSVYTALPDAVMRANVPVYVDVISTTDAAALAGYSVESCYAFHGYIVESAAQVSLSGGLSGVLRSYADPRGGTDWTILAWEWPTDREGAVRYERVVLLLPDGDDATFTDVPTTDLDSRSDRFDDAEHLVLTLARTMVANQVASDARAGGG